MLLRRMMFLAALLLFTSVLAGGLVERERDAQRATAPETTPSAPAAGLPTVAGRLPAQKVVRATVGDLVSLTVTPSAPGEATIPALGVSAPADPIVPGTLEFVAEDPGRFPVLLDGAGQALGTVVVAPRA